MLHSLQPSPAKKLVHQSCISSRSEKCDCRFLVQEESNPSLRMVTSPRDCAKNIQDMGNANDRPVRHQQEQETSSLHISSTRSRSLGRRRSFSELDRPERLCVSPSSNHLESPGEDYDRVLPDHPDSFSLASPILVHHASGDVNRPSSQTSSDSKASETDRQEHFSFKPRSSSSACLEAARGKLQNQGYSSELADRILGPQRISTRKVYSSRWTIFCSWCKTLKKNPIKTSTPVLAEFLNYLFQEKKLSPRTIEGYRTAIADFLRFHTKEDFNNNFILNNLIKSFKSECPRPKSTFPKWDLALVLNFLLEAPFEPLAKCEMKFLTWKTVFLVTLAMAARCSEVHALTFEDLGFGDNYRYAVVSASPEFQPKTKIQNKQVKIPALGSAARGAEEDKLLCPVRALKIYRARTDSSRKEHPEIKRLFISYMKGFSKDICKNTLSGWIRSLIKFTYQKCPFNTIQLSAARPHEVRALSTSMAWKANLALDEILHAACWSNHNTFTAFYLKDLSLIKGQLHSLGPLVAAQNIINFRDKFFCTCTCTCTCTYTFTLVNDPTLSEGTSAHLVFWRVGNDLGDQAIP